MALGGGVSEGFFLKGVIQLLVLGPVELKVMGVNTSAIAIGVREGASRLKHLDGRLLWLQQRQQLGGLQLRCAREHKSVRFGDKGAWKMQS